MVHAFGTRAAIKAAYLDNLVSAYAWAAEGSPTREAGLAAASKAADAALAGKLNLEGDCWWSACAANGIHKNSPRRVFAALPN
jgi:hypothetical protein